VLWRSFGGEALLARAGHDGIDRLSGGAWEVWELLDEPRSLAEVISILSKAHRISADVLGPRLQDVVQDLLRRRWIEEVPAPVRKRVGPARSRA
jgi:hypothetical protein